MLNQQEFKDELSEESLEKYSDEEIRQMRDDMHTLAELIFEQMHDEKY